MLSSSKINPDLNLSDLHYLYKHIIRTISLPDFLESETSQDIIWVRTDMSAKCCCPLHEEEIPSFNIDLKEDVWIYFCFGCGAKGNIIHFCKDFHGLRNQLESIYYICQKYNIQNTSDLILEGIKKVSVKIDEQRVIENMNILVSNQCRMLLRKNYALHSSWVSKCYRRLNKAADDGNKEELSRIDHEASKRMNMKVEL